MTFDQRILILNSFITSHFSDCMIVWMFYSRKLNERNNHILERALKIVYKNLNLLFQELLIEDNSLNIHYRNLQKLLAAKSSKKNVKSSKLRIAYHLSSWMMFLSLSKNHTPYEQLPISGGERSVQQNMA